MDERCHLNTLVNFSRVLSLDSFQIFSFCLPAYWSQERPLNYCKGLKIDPSLIVKRLSPLERSGNCVSSKTLQDKSSLSVKTAQQHFAKKLHVVSAHSFWASPIFAATFSPLSTGILETLSYLCGFCDGHRGCLGMDSNNHRCTWVFSHSSCSDLSSLSLGLWNCGHSETLCCSFSFTIFLLWCRMGQGIGCHPERVWSYRWQSVRCDKPWIQDCIRRITYQKFILKWWPKSISVSFLAKTLIKCVLYRWPQEFFLFFSAVSNVFPSISQGIPQAPNISTLLAHTVPTTDVWQILSK